MTRQHQTKRLFAFCLLLFSAVPHLLHASEHGQLPPVLYGENPQTGKFVEINGINMYYEIYGEGEPVVLIHGNGQSIAAMQHQANHFSRDYQVIVADSRGHGKSGMGEGPLNYVQMADDWASLFTHLNLAPARVIGWSDGGNVSLLLAIKYPQMIDRIAIMGANLRPDESAVHSWAVAWVAAESKRIDEMISTGDTSEDWATLKQHFGLLREQPQISLDQLGQITAPVLVMAGDRDVIREEHTILMFQNIPRSQLAIFPGQTHFIPDSNPELFNSTVEKFMGSPFEMPSTRDIMLAH